jgi:hypothetical protein
MKPLFIYLASSVFLFPCALSVRAQNYSIDWFTIDGGGGASTGGVYQVAGTIGQPDAGGPMNGGNFSVTGGFWSLYAVITPGAPLLTISRTPTNAVIVSWPSPSTGFGLQSNTNLATANWMDFGGAVNDNGVTRSVVFSSPTGNLYFRLKK